MKRKTLVFFAVLMMSVSTLLANNIEDVNKKVAHSFNKEFVHAKNVRWTTTDAFVKVSFTLNEQLFFAYYSQDGERIAISRHIAVASLPMSLTSDLNKSYNNYWITDAFEIVTKEENAYYVTIENADYKVTLKSSGLDSWSTFKRTSKD